MPLGQRDRQVIISAVIARRPLRRSAGVLLFAAGLALAGVRSRPPGRSGDGSAGLRPVILLTALAVVGAVNEREARRQRAALAAAAGESQARAGERDPASARLLARTCLPAAMAAVIISEAVPAAGFGQRASRAALAAGLGMTAAGIVVRQRAIGTLGRFFTGAVMTQPGHRLIQAGPYRVIRHPGYAGIWLQAAGIGLASGNAAGLAICLLLPPVGIVPRIRAEDVVLGEAFPDEFPGYAGRTRRLVPFAW